MIYLDYQATTPLAPEARDAMLPWLGVAGEDGYANPHSAHALVRRLLEANGRGYWDVDTDVLEKLQEISRDLEDQLEGVAP